MTTALELGSKKCIDDVKRQSLTHHARTHRQHVGIVVLADHAG